MLYTQDGSCAVLYEQLEQMDDGPSWTIITQIPVKNMRQLANTVLQIGCLTAGLCFLASSLLYLLLSGDVVRRVQKLSLYICLLYTSAAGNDVVMPGGPPVIVQILKGYEEGRVTREELQQAVSHLLSLLKRFGRYGAQRL